MTESTSFPQQKRSLFFGIIEIRSLHRLRTRQTMTFLYLLFCKIHVIACVITATAFAQSSPPEIQPVIVRVIPHATMGFTQGLLFHENLLYEGTGLYNKSGIHLINPNDGSVFRSISLVRYFGEGIALYKNKMFQLTWKSEVALSYSFPELNLVDTLTYHGEGWGLASDSAFLIMSNGSDTLFFRDSTFSIQRRLPVQANGYPVKHLNELEFARGMIYANIWYKNYLVEIDPSNGKVARLIDCKPLLAVEKPPSAQHALNGIAYRPDTDTFYLTGKNWKHIFEVSIPRIQ